MDGQSAVVQHVHVELGAESLRLMTTESAQLDWPLAELTLDETQEHVAHVHYAAQPLALLALRDPALIAALRARTARSERLPGGRRPVRFALTCIVAIAALGGSFYAAVPGLSRALARRVPLEYERELGASVAPLLAREYCHSEAAASALAELKQRLDPRGEIAANLHILRASMANAFALPGGDVVLTSGLLEEAHSADEVAGVLAHELAHVQERHVMSHFIRASLLTAAWSVALGDYAGLMVLDPSTAFEIANLRHSRADEAEADQGAARLLDEAGVSRQGLIDFFERIKADTDALPEWLSNHPTSAGRAAELSTRGAASSSHSAALPAEGFEALRAACR